MQNRNDTVDRAEKIAALQRLLAQALESGISARSVAQNLPALAATKDRQPSPPAA